MSRLRLQQLHLLLLVIVTQASTCFALGRCSLFDGKPNECKAFFEVGHYSYYIPDGYNISYVEVIVFFIGFSTAIGLRNSLPGFLCSY